jgi:hypothetical protein
LELALPVELPDSVPPHAAAIDITKAKNRNKYFLLIIACPSNVVVIKLQSIVRHEYK